MMQCTNIAGFGLQNITRRQYAVKVIYEGYIDGSHDLSFRLLYKICFDNELFLGRLYFK